MIHVSQSGTLLLQSHNNNAFISAASGLCWIGSHLYVIADDALHLGVFESPFTSPGMTIPLLTGELPLEYKARKAAKPDFEVLTHWKNFPESSGGALVALGSGSRKNRCICVLVPLNTDGSIASAAQSFDLGILYSHLDSRIPALNIEGAVFTPEELWLFQRGNSAKGKNAIIRLPHTLFTQYLKTPDTPTSPLTTSDIHIHEIPLGTLDKIPLGFTDATSLSDGRILFSAAAEATENTYNDGSCTGSVIGLLSVDKKNFDTDAIDFKILWQKPIDQLCKVEGIATKTSHHKTECLLVTDADDTNAPAMLLKTELAF